MALSPVVRGFSAQKTATAGRTSKLTHRESETPVRRASQNASYFGLAAGTQGAARRLGRVNSGLSTLPRPQTSTDWKNPHSCGQSAGSGRPSVLSGPEFLLDLSGSQAPPMLPQRRYEQDARSGELRNHMVERQAV